MEISQDLIIRGDAYIDGLRGSGDRNVGVGSEGQLKIIDPPSETVNVQSITNTLTLMPDSATRQILTPLGGSRIVNLPTTNVATGKRFVIHNDAAVNTNLTLTVQPVYYNNLQSGYDLAPQHAIECIWTGTRWITEVNSNTTIGSATSNLNSIAVGTNGSLNNAISIGSGGTITNSISIGRNNGNIQGYSAALGNSVWNINNRAIAIGHTAANIGNDSVGIGAGVHAVDSGSVAIGAHTQAQHSKSVAVGYASRTHRPHEIASNTYDTTGLEATEWKSGVKIQKYERFLLPANTPINTWVDMPITSGQHLYIYEGEVYNFDYKISAAYSNASYRIAQAWQIRGCVASHNLFTNRLYFLPINGYDYVVETFGDAFLDARLVLDQNNYCMKLQVAKTSNSITSPVAFGAVVIANELFANYI